MDDTAPPTKHADFGKPRLTPPGGADFWVFAYGSLIWRPGFTYAEARLGRLRGYHRRACVISEVYRGTPEAPGLVLGLDRGGSCNGLVYRVSAEVAHAVMDYLHEREMVTAAYTPRWLRVDTDIGRVTAAGFVVDHAHRQYAGGLNHGETLRLIRQGEGRNGHCLDYLRATVDQLTANGTPDRGLEALVREAEAAA